MDYEKIANIVINFSVLFGYHYSGGDVKINYFNHISAPFADVKEFMMKNVFLSMLLIAAMSAPAVAQEPAQQGVKEVAQNWLVLVDNDQFEESYQETASHFQDQLTLGQWIGSLKQVRKAMGKVTSRKFLSSTYMTELPNAPKGEYVVVLFESVLEDGRKAVETVTPMRDKDAQWRVSGYYIKPLPN